MRAVKTEHYARYMDALRDEKAKARIESRVLNLCLGNAGDAKPVGEGVSVLRVHYEPGYRVYYRRHGREVYILLAAGTKSTQDADIRLAKEIARSI